MNVEEYIKTAKKLPLDTKTILHLMIVHNKMQEQLAAALKPFEVSLQQFNVLRILRGQGNTPANLCTINDRMVSRMSNTTRLVDKLVAKGYVARNTCKENRRKVEIRITDTGLHELKKMDRAIKNTERHLLSALDRDDLEQMNILLDKV